jgi:ubiquinone/menaquinone biosynthesis C-methylase UbiE
MNTQIDQNNERQAAIAFDGQSAIFDELYAGEGIIQYKRNRVREHLLKYLKPGSHILELNAGTGDDAVYLAKIGFRVHATDISRGMQEKLMEKVAFNRLAASVTNEVCSYTDLPALKNKGPFDCIFSNFAGLNCTGDLDQVLAGFDALLKPDGIVVLVILPRFCLWESLFFLKGKFRTAFRRFFSSNGRKANIDGASFTCWYYSPAYIKRNLQDRFYVLEVEGLCTIVPPSYVDKFPEKYPKIYSYLCKTENRYKNKWPWKYIGDYYIISLRKK